MSIPQPTRRRAARRGARRYRAALPLVCAVLLALCPARAADDVTLTQVFAAVDANHDHAISEGEFAAALQALTGGVAVDGGPPLPPGGAAGRTFARPHFENPAGTAAFFKALFASFSAIMATEIGDKTFFIAALLAARTSKLLTFAGCAGALALMTVISVAVGQIFHAVPASFTRGLPIDDYVAIASFLYFGVKSLLDARAIEEDNAGIAEEREDAEETLKAAASELKGGWPLVIEAFTLTVVAEIGDRSQLATIALSAAGNPFSVCAGATAGHFLATGTAVIAGSYLSNYLSERGILILGGVLFLLFAFTTAFGIF